MNYQNSLRYTAQPAIGLGFRQQLQKRKALGVPGGSALWLAATKIILIVAVLVAGLNFWLGSLVSKVNDSIVAIETQRHQLKNDQIALLAERAVLMSEVQVKKDAGEKLALFVPEQEQVYKLR